MIKDIPVSALTTLSLDLYADVGLRFRTSFLDDNLSTAFKRYVAILTDILVLADLNHYPQIVPGEIDFVYLRFDFDNKCNVAYAFVNFTSGRIRRASMLQSMLTLSPLAISLCSIPLCESSTRTKMEHLPKRQGPTGTVLKRRV